MRDYEPVTVRLAGAKSMTQGRGALLWYRGPGHTETDCLEFVRRALKRPSGTVRMLPNNAGGELVVEVR